MCDARASASLRLLGRALFMPRAAVAWSVLQAGTAKWLHHPYRASLSDCASTHLFEPPRVHWSQLCVGLTRSRPT